MNELEKSIINICGLTLAGYKPSSLQAFHFKEIETFISDIVYLENKLSEIDIKLKVIKLKDNFALVLIYNEKMLSKYLNTDENFSFLLEYGYKNYESLDATLNHLVSRMEMSDFPHEIGVFLGYPVEDIKGYIANPFDYKYSGFWKVYSDVDNKIKIFNYYKAKLEEIKHKALSSNSLKQIFLSN